MFIASALFTNVSTLATGGAAALPAAAPAASGATSAERGNLASPTTPDRAPTADSVGKSTASAAPTLTGSGFSISTTLPQDAAARAAQAPSRDVAKPEAPLISLSPWFWLGLALILGAIALALQRRLRSA